MVSNRHPKGIASNLNTLKVETYKIKGWRNEVSGLLIDENEEWILVHHIPVDSKIDGFKIYAKKFVEQRISSDKEKGVENALKEKQFAATKPTGFEFGSVVKILGWIEDKFGLFGFQDNIENEMFYGQLVSVIDNLFKIEQVAGNGKTDDDYEFDLNEIRSISFMTEYFESLRS